MQPLFLEFPLGCGFFCFSGHAIPSKKTKKSSKKLYSRTPWSVKNICFPVDKKIFLFFSCQAATPALNSLSLSRQQTNGLWITCVYPVSFLKGSLVETTIAPWSDVLKKLKNILSRQTIENWFAPIKNVTFTENAALLEVPNKFFQEWVRDHYEQILEKVLEETLGKKIAIQYKIVSPGDGGREKKLEPLRKEIQRFPSTPSSSETQLNPKYSFDNFIVGSSNRFAHAASIAVAQNPAKAYNPLFIYGGVGLGKTHLIQAIGQYILARNKNTKVCYVSSERFTNELIDAIQNSKTLRFRNTYRHVDVLMLDDIQFFSGKEHSQEELFHTFNTLYDARKQIIFSSDRPPKEIPNMEDRLVSRFEWGLVTDLQPPDIETRVAILKKKAELSGIHLPDEITFFLAEKIKSNIRKLEGALIRVLSYASLTNQNLSISLAEDVLQDLLAGEDDLTITIEIIQKQVAQHYDVRLADMTSKKRPKAIAFPRQVAMYLARNMTRYSLPEIGEAFGGRDHTTVMHACKLVDEMVSKDYNLKTIVHTLQNKIKNTKASK